MITNWTGALVLPLIVFAFVSGGLERATGATAGAALAIFNWLVIRWVVTGLIDRAERSQTVWMSVLVAKIGFVLASAAVMLRVFDPTGLVIGTSAIVLGIFCGALHAHGSSVACDVSRQVAGERD